MRDLPAPIQRQRRLPSFELNSRCLDILRLLLAAEEPRTAAFIGDQLGISARMVRSSLVPAGKWLAVRGVTLKSIQGRGLWLEGSREAKAALKRLMRECDQPVLWLAPSERLYVVLLHLFFARTPPQIKQLEESLNLSRTTTMRVMDAAGDWLQQHRLTLVRRQNYGSMIAGEEPDWREAVVDLLRESVGDARLLALLRGTKTMVDASAPVKSGLERALQSAWKQLDVASVKAAISPLEFDRMLPDQEYIELVLHLAILIYRNRIGRMMAAAPSQRDETPSAQQIAMTAQVASCIQKQCGLPLHEGEMAWLESRLREVKPLPSRRDLSVAEARPPGDPPTRALVDGILADASLALHPSLSTDADLERNLITRLGAMLQPTQHRQALSNPLLQDVRSQYPYVYSTARQSGQRVAEQLGRELDEAEVGEIAVCLIAAMERRRLADRPTRKVLVVCSEGVVTAWLLVSRLRAEFPDVEVVDVISALELESRRHLDGIDFIVSTIPLKVKNVPSRQVSPLLGVADCRGLKELFERKPNGEARENPSDASAIHLGDLVTAQTIELGVEAQSWEEVVEKASRKLLQEGLIESRFIEGMKNVIREHGPYMVIWPGVALLHAPPHGIRQLSMGLINLREPVCFGHPHNDPVRAAIVLAATGTRAHIPALLELSRMMQDEEARAAICSTGHKPVVLHWIAHYSK